jgi:hypothetical protein
MSVDVDEGILGGYISWTGGRSFGWGGIMLGFVGGMDDDGDAAVSEIGDDD